MRGFFRCDRCRRPVCVGLRGTGTDPVPAAGVNAYLGRQVQYDSDMWILEIEDPKSVFSLDASILDL